MSNKEEQIRLRLSKGEKEALMAAARENCIPVATWVRSVALKAAREVLKDETTYLLSSSENEINLSASIAELNKEGQP